MLSMTPGEVRALSPEEAKALCTALREELIRVVPQTGGYLASNLGVAEISVALTRVMDLPREAGTAEAPVEEPVEGPEPEAEDET